VPVFGLTFDQIFQFSFLPKEFYLAEPTIRHEKSYASGTKSLLIGLIITHAIATLHVYASNTALYEKMQVIISSGYRPVPNHHILPHLKNVWTACCGAVFFTLTIGCFLSLLSFSLAWLCSRGGHAYRRWGYALFTGCCVLLVWEVNANGILPFASAYVAVVMPVVFASAFPAMAQTKAQTVTGTVKNPRKPLLYWGPVFFLVLLWMIYPNQKIFADFRDTLLLSNGLGLKINDFYYDYTLYPAETFKPLDQKVLKTVYLESFPDTEMAGRLRRILMARDYLPVDQEKIADLVMSLEKDRLIFRDRGGRGFSVSQQDFFNTPGRTMKTVSRALDRNLFFRSLTFISLLAGLPAGLYLFLFSGLRFVASPLCGVKTGSVLAAVLCFCIGITPLVPYWWGKKAPDGKEEIRRLAASRSSWDRVDALKRIYANKLEIDDFQDLLRLRDDGSVPERYWLAMALANSKMPDTIADLLKMTNDRHPNVAYKTFYALGKRKDPSAIPILLKKLDASDHWYEQVYAYHALRELGWKQTGSG
jgi:hypothetical protein